MANGKAGQCKSDAQEKPARMPKQPVTNVFGKSKTRTGNVSGPKHS